MIRRCYIYLGTKDTDPRWVGKKCYAVLNKDGKCTRGKTGTMLVEFPGQGIVNVVARRLRKVKK